MHGRRNTLEAPKTQGEGLVGKKGQDANLDLNLALASWDLGPCESAGCRFVGNDLWGRKLRDFDPVVYQNNRY